MDNKGLLALAAAAVLNSGCIEEGKVQELKEQNAQRASEIISNGEEVLIISDHSKPKSCFYDSITEVTNKTNPDFTSYILSSSKNSCDDYRIHYLSEIRGIIDVSPYQEGVTCTYDHKDLTIKGGNWNKYDTEFTNVHGESINETFLIPEQIISPSPIMTFDYSKCEKNTGENN